MEHLFETAALKAQLINTIYGQNSKCGQILSQPTVQHILNLHDNILQMVFLKPQHQIKESVTN
jgi:hypothetical protein